MAHRATRADRRAATALVRGSRRRRIAPGISSGRHVDGVSAPRALERVDKVSGVSVHGEKRMRVPIGVESLPMAAKQIRLRRELEAERFVLAEAVGNQV